MAPPQLIVFIESQDTAMEGGLATARLSASNSAGGREDEAMVLF